MIRWVGLGWVGKEKETDRQAGRKGFCAGGGRFRRGDSYADHPVSFPVPSTSFLFVLYLYN